MTKKPHWALLVLVGAGLAMFMGIATAVLSVRTGSICWSSTCPVGWYPGGKQ